MIIYPLSNYKEKEKGKGGETALPRKLEGMKEVLLVSLPSTSSIIKRDINHYCDASY